MNKLLQELKKLETQSIILGNEIGKGGEGTVFAIQNAPNFAVKVYHKPPSRDKIEKILAMIRIKNEHLIKLSTWPLASYYSNKGDIVGFVMPRLSNHSPLYELYNPKLRLQSFPRADWRFLVHASMNIARAFKTVHESGHVIGDVNHGNLVVAHDATVRFIDTDSFQIMEGNHSWFCEVGVSTHLPPELQGLSTFKGLVRSPNHDNFGLAVLIFQLLFLARHPFSGRFLGKGDMPIEKAIAEYRFSYSSNHQSLQMIPPPASLSMEALTAHLRLLFERAFSKEGSGMQVGLRPTPDEWITALTTLTAMLKPCSLNNGHYFNREMKQCPWCEIEISSGLILFPVLNQTNISELDISALLSQIDNIKTPGYDPIEPSLQIQILQPSVEAKEIKENLVVPKVACFIIGLMILWVSFCLILSNPLGMAFGTLIPIIYSVGALAFYQKQKKKLSKDVLTNLETVKEDWVKLILNWKPMSSRSPFLQLRQSIDNLRKAYESLEAERKHRLQEINAASYNKHMNTHLNNFRIADASLQGIGVERISTLKRHGIETAADIESSRLEAIKGFGVVFCTRLLDWRQKMEKRFILKSNNYLTGHEMALVNQEISKKQQSIKSELNTKASQLSLCATQINERRNKLTYETKELLLRYSQAVADAKEIGLQY